MKIKVMGSCFSFKSSSILKHVRVVNLNGFVEDFEQPISANLVIDNPSKHFVCTSIQLLSISSKPLKGDTQLQIGQVYFMLPYSILQAVDFSPVDLACIAKKLTAIAKAKPCDYNNSFTAWSSPLRSPARVGVGEQIGMMNGGRSPGRLQSWKPILDTITEKPIHRGRWSDLQEFCSSQPEKANTC